jgi:predicted dehydrogenase
VNDLRVALVGYGLSGRVFHGPLLSATPGFVVSSIVTADAERRAQARLDYPDARLLADPDGLWRHPADHDLVVVATPTGTHVALAGQALGVGLAVVVEKPLAPTAPEARGLIDRAVARRSLLSVFHNRRWDSDHLTLRRLIGERALGEVMRYESRFERWRPDPNPDAWREREPPGEGGGVLLDLGVHLVDQALSLFGPVTAVYAEVFSRRGGADDDVFLALEHGSGVRAHLWAGALSAAPGPRLRVLGTRAAFVVEGLDGQEDALRAGQRPDEPTFGQEPKARWGRLLRGDAGEPVVPEPGRWRQYYLELGRAVRDGSPLPVEASDAVAGLEVLDAARRSADDHTVVHLTPDPPMNEPSR